MGQMILKIDRSKPFDPAAFLGPGWDIVEEDERALALAEVDLTKVQLKHMLKPWEKRINGEEKLRRLKEAGLVRLDAGVFEALWEHREMIPEKWKEKTNGYPTFVFFDGTLLCAPSSRRCLLYLYGNGGRWDWSYRWVGSDWYPHARSAVVAS